MVSTACENDPVVGAVERVELTVAGDSIPGDTIESARERAVRVTLTEDGHPVSGVRVHLRLDTGYPGVVLRDDGFDSQQTTTTTNAEGDFEFGALIYSHVTDTAAIVVRVPKVQFEDTLAYAVLPGAPLSLRVGDRGTFLSVGRPRQMAPVGVDRRGNRSPRGVTCSGGDPSIVIVAPDCTITAVSVGRTDYTFRLGDLTAETGLQTVPAGVIVAEFVVGETRMAALDDPRGESFRTPYSFLGGRWWPGTDSLVVRTENDGLALVGSDGTGRVLVEDPTDSHAVCLAGDRLVFSDSTATWSMERDGTGVRRLAEAMFVSDVSPDCSRLLAYREDNWVIASVPDESISPLGVSGSSFRWSPRGDWIAYLGPAEIINSEFDRQPRLIRPDGTGDVGFRRRPTPGFGALTWSPDGRFLALKSTVSGGGDRFGNARPILVLEVATDSAFYVAARSQGRMDWRPFPAPPRY